MLRRLLAVLVLALLPLQMTVADTAAGSPEKALVFRADLDQALMVWLPPTVGLPDAYRVYGYTVSGDSEPLVDTILLTATVPAGYNSYAVVALYGAVESMPAEAEPCSIDIRNDIPPNVQQSCTPPI